MNDYTPTTEQVRLDYVMAYSEKESSQILAERDFDRWLAAHDAEVAAKAVSDALVSVRAERDAAVAALVGAPEPEWEYAAGYIALDGKPHPFENRGYLRFVAEADREKYGSGEAILVRRRKAGPWLPVEGEKP